MLAAAGQCLREHVRARCRELAAAGGKRCDFDRLTVRPSGHRAPLGVFFTNAPALLSAALGVAPERARGALEEALRPLGGCFVPVSARDLRLMAFALAPGALRRAAEAFIRARAEIPAAPDSLAALAAARALRLSQGAADCPRDLGERALKSLARVLDTPRKARIGGAVARAQLDWLLARVESFSIDLNPEADARSAAQARFLLRALAAALQSWAPQV